MSPTYFITQAERVGVGRPKGFGCWKCQDSLKSWSYAHLVIRDNPTTEEEASWIVAICSRCVPLFLERGELEE